MSNFSCTTVHAKNTSHSCHSHTLISPYFTHHCIGCYLILLHMLVLTQVLSLMQLLVWSCDMHVMEDGQSNDLKALDVVLNKTTHANGVTEVCGAVGHASSYLPPFSFSLLVRLREGEKGRWTPSAKVSSGRGSCCPGM